MSTFDKLWKQGKRIAQLQGILRLIEWDQETFMPKGAAASRADQIEHLAGLIHEEKTAPHFLKELESIDPKPLEAWQQAAIREWKEDARKDTALETSFVQAFAKLSSESMEVWRKARAEADFSLFAPYLERIVEMCREQAEKLGYEKSPYDALMDLYEPKLTVEKIAPLFTQLKGEISTLLKKIPVKDNGCLAFEVSKEKQMAFGELLLKAMGYDFNHGRLDLSTHPFSTSMHPTDSRVTTRILKASYFDNLSAVMHEGGHGLYEMQLDAQYFGTPICESRSLGIHESQSRTWETFVGQSHPFWQHFFPKLKEHYGFDTGFEEFYQAINRVKPTFIRVEADEVTYCLHVILRFEIEKELIEGKISVKEVPELWNQKMQDSLGITPPSDKEGCLQDVHWSMGAFGYFPTYALGTLYGAQFFESFKKRFPEWSDRFAKGELLFLRDWQKEEIHCHGRMYSTDELIERVTGSPLTLAPYLNYLQKKYLGKGD